MIDYQELFGLLSPEMIAENRPDTSRPNSLEKSYYLNAMTYAGYGMRRDHNTYHVFTPDMAVTNAVKSADGGYAPASVLLARLYAEGNWHGLDPDACRQMVETFLQRAQMSENNVALADCAFFRFRTEKAGDSPKSGDLLRRAFAAYKEPFLPRMVLELLEYFFFVADNADRESRKMKEPFFREGEIDRLLGSEEYKTLYTDALKKSISLRKREPSDKGLFGKGRERLFSGYCRIEVAVVAKERESDRAVFPAGREERCHKIAELIKAHPDHSVLVLVDDYEEASRLKNDLFILDVQGVIPSEKDTTADDVWCPLSCGVPWLEDTSRSVVYGDVTEWILEMTGLCVHERNAFLVRGVDECLNDLSRTLFEILLLSSSGPVKGVRSLRQLQSVMSRDDVLLHLSCEQETMMDKIVGSFIDTTMKKAEKEGDTANLLRSIEALYHWRKYQANDEETRLLSRMLMGYGLLRIYRMSPRLYHAHELERNRLDLSLFNKKKTVMVLPFPDDRELHYPTSRLLFKMLQYVFSADYGRELLLITDDPARTQV